METFNPPSWLRGPHAQTFGAAFWRRKFPALPRGVQRDFEVEPGTSIRAYCHWQERPQERATLVLLHGLEGSSESGYMLGLAARAFTAGWNAVRLNQRNCGGSESLTPTLYHSGLSADYRAVFHELAERDGLPEIYGAGYSMGGNLLLKMSGEFAGQAPRPLRGIVAVSPAMDLAACADALALPGNSIYQWWFVANLKRGLARKARLFPGQFNLSALGQVRTVREFDDRITARYFGFRDASDYYAQSSALRLAAEIRIPTLLLIAQDDPFVPMSSFGHPALSENPWITLVATTHGGHCAFISQANNDRRFWAEWRTMDFCSRLSSRKLEIAPANGQRPVKEPQFLAGERRGD